MSLMTLLRRPSAFLPIAMSLTALGVVVTFLAMYGVVHETDEGTAAHVWQLLMGGQLPIIAFFAFRWLPRAPGDAIPILAIQFAAGLLSAAPVFLLGL